MNIRKQHAFIKWFSRLIDQGYSIEEALERLSFIEKNTTKRLKEKLELGYSLNEALRTLRFKSFAYDLVTIGLENNCLDRCLQLLVKRYEFSLFLYKRWQELLFYPCSLFLIAMVAFEYLRLQLYPLFLRLTNSPFIEHHSILTFFSFHLLKVILIGIIALFVVFRRFPRLLNLFPLVRELRTLSFCHQLNVFIQSGYSLEESLHVLRQQKSFSNDIDYFEERIIGHKNTSVKLSMFTEGFIQMFLLGFKTNSLTEHLTDYETLYTELCETKIKRVSHGLQYGLFFIIAINILMVYYVMMEPIMKIINYL